ncbi:transient receptor potential channel pyrexia-like isoform X3 [Monomorium pharaonis]|uniref:transient receptor potential channel pyrexia-like isoform X3 n=1 Tax=Monomorium pharaonis TaxID=307658 RepID=UPI0017469D6C|nr:transient receptor potential channel pyrexia-like isoform X3 [Monomorium pharaonis]
METLELQNLLNLLNSKNSSSDIMENLHKFLLDAIESKNFQCFKQIVEENLEKQPTIVKYVDPDTRDTYLDKTSREGLTEFVKFLLCIEGAEINRVNEMHNCAPIHFATMGGHVDTLTVLLTQHTIDVDLEVEQRTALHIALENNDLKCAVLLLEKGASVNILDNENRTALHLAAIKNQHGIVKMILDKYTQCLEVDRYKDCDNQTTREVIERKFPELKKELSEKLPFKDKNSKINTQDLKYHLNNKDEANFLKCIELFQEEISPNIIENLLTKSMQYNFQQAVIAILNKFKGKHFNVKKVICETVQNGHLTILKELLKVKPQMINDLLLSVCQELEISPERENDNLLKCLKLILEQDNADVRCTDKKGNTPLHYAARADNRKAISLLLKRGSYIGHMNKFNVPPIVDIPVCTLSSYFDDCLTMVKDQTNKYVIEFDYHCLMPNVFTKQDLNRRVARETEVFLYIARNKSLKHLLKHPLLSSFLYLKWLKIRHVLYANFMFYGVFYFLLNAYILNMTYESPLNENKKQIVNNSFNIALETSLCPDSNCLRIFVIVLWSAFTLREIFQFACCPYRYVMDWENWLQVVLITFILIMLCNATLWSGVVVIIVSALELVVLISHHPKMSASFEMFRTVSLTYMSLLFPYIFLIIAFALAFHTLFKSNEDFSGLGLSFFKTIIMITGEFSSNDIPFISQPVWSHIVFVLFVFLIAIVLYNLLNGLAVNDTNNILSKAELFGLISRIRLIVYLEDVAFGEPFNWFNCENSRFLRWTPFAFLINRILLFPHYLKNSKINVIYNNLDAYNDKYYVHNNSMNREKDWPILEMDPDIIKQAKRIISDKNQLSDNEKIMNVLNKQQEKLIAIELALKKLNLIT